ncbi:MAG: hypothetical protein NTW38_06805 [Candidatus Aminicenantes bacterium]|nr:hypothetical protein [Candidatus Aminicenantes bacterium]
MLQRQQKTPLPKEPRSFLWLGLAGLLLLLAHGRWTIPLAAFLAPFFMIRFLRKKKPWPGLLIGATVYSGVCLLSLSGILPFRGVYYFFYVVVISCISFLPYMADRLLAPRLMGFPSIFIFPLAATSLEYINSLTGPFGYWGSQAYSQYGNLAFLQILSVTGLWGLSFMVTWFGPTANWIWENKSDWKKVRFGAGVYVLALASILLFGGARLVFGPPASKTVRVAAVMIPDPMAAKQNSAEVESLSRRLYRGEKLTDSELFLLRETYQEAQDYLFQQSEFEARAGAKIIFWAEGDADVLKQDEAALQERGRQLAIRYQIYLGMSIHTKNPEAYPLRQNKVVLAEPSGKISWEYHKRHMVPGTGEGFSIRPGNGKLLWTDTPYGRIAAVICFDQDFYDIIRQMGRTGIDILFVPSHDWKDIASIRAKMAVFRSIEQGFSLVRPTSGGISLAVDGMGRIAAAMNYFTTDNSSMSAFVPIKRTKTVYSKIGDVFAWICMLGFILLAGMGLRKKRSDR